MVDLGKKLPLISCSQLALECGVILLAYRYMKSCDRLRYVRPFVKPMNKGHPRERQLVVFIDKWSLFGGYFVIFYQGVVNEVGPLLTGCVFIQRWPLIQVYLLLHVYQ